MIRSLWSVVKGAESWGDFAQRMTGPKSASNCIWVHAASVGEINAVRLAIEHIALSENVLLTTTTTSGRETATHWQHPNVTVGLAPLDIGWLTKWFLRRNRITALIIVENELWPARILAAQAKHLPLLMLNARMSEATMRTWRRFPKTAARIFKAMAQILPQDQNSAERLKHLGADAAKIHEPFNLKSLYTAKTTPLPAELAAFDRTVTLLAAATHAGEEKIVLEAFQLCRSKNPALRLIIAPRHPKRAAEIVTLAENSGLSTSQRSKDATADGDILIADTLGEMHLWYRISGAAFIGGSLVEKGGHTPFEPAAYRCPIIHGPHIDNFQDGYATITELGPIWSISNAHDLAAAFLDALGKKGPEIASQDQAKAIFNVLTNFCEAETPKSATEHDQI